jgi:hypothetical protein
MTLGCECPVDLVLTAVCDKKLFHALHHALPEIGIESTHFCITLRDASELQHFEGWIAAQ